jgi:hypothetical protein
VFVNLSRVEKNRNTQTLARAVVFVLSEFANLWVLIITPWPERAKNSKIKKFGDFFQRN